MTPPPHGSSSSTSHHLSQLNASSSSSSSSQAHAANAPSNPCGHDRRLSTTHACENLRERATNDRSATTKSFAVGSAQSPPHCYADNAQPVDASAPPPQYSANTFESWIARFAPSKGSEAERCFESATLSPPITVSSLSELEIGNIVVNAKLRHDINFDRELHFRPNVEGSRGKEKLQQAKDYWIAVEAELEFYAFMHADPHGAEFRGSAQWSQHFRSRQKRVPQMLGAIRDVTASLMPDTERASIAEVIDVSLISQQIVKGVFDLFSIAQWLGSLLKGHCAPMRDQWVDRMLKQMASCSATTQAQLVVEAMKELFGILEAMRLDVANHQIRYLRPTLLEQTFEFEAQYFQRKLQSGQLPLAPLTQWYKKITHDFHAKRHSTPSTTGTRFAAFTEAWLRTLVDARHSLPASFKLDVDRIATLREDVRNLMYKHICWIAFQTVVTSIKPSEEISDSTIETVMDHVAHVVGRSASESRWQHKMSNVAAEIVRLALKYLEQQQVADSSISLGALSDDVERWLQKSLNTSSAPYRQAAEALRRNMTRLVLGASQDLMTLAPSEVFEALAEPLPGSPDKCWVENYFARSSGSPLRLATSGQDQRLLQIVKRATQINVLHWRVFAPLVYEADDETLQWLADGPSRPVSTTSSESRLFNLSHDSASTLSRSSSECSTRPASPK